MNPKMRTFLFVFWSLACFSLDASAQKHGVHDLSRWDPSQESIQELNKSWLFFWNQFPENVDLPFDIPSANAVEISAPITWEGQEQQNFKLGPEGYATYYTKVILPPSAPFLSIHIPVIQSAYEVWVNGKLVQSMGRVGTSEETVITNLRQSIVDLGTLPEEIEIVLKVSNYQVYFGGFHRPIKLGASAAIHESRVIDIALDSLMIGALLLIAVYHFGLWVRIPDRFGPLVFGLFCFNTAVRSCFAGSARVAWVFVSDIDWAWAHRIEYFCFPMSLILFSYFIRILYPEEHKSWIHRGIVWVSSLWAILILVTENRIYAHFLYNFQFFAALSGLTVIIVLIVAIFHKRQGAILFLLGFFGLFGTVINDILMGQGLDTVPLIQFGVAFFTMSQALVLSSRFALAFERIHQAERQIRELNDGLEIQVLDRTREIRAIIENVKSGFVLIDEHGGVREGFTQSCHEIFGKKIKSGQKLWEICELSTRDAQHIEAGIFQVFDDMIASDVCLAQMPQHFDLGDRMISLEGGIVRNEEGKIESILYTINDVTNLFAAERKAAQNANLLKIVKQMDAFRNFLADSREKIHRIKEVISPDTQDIVRGELHTIKGNSASFGLQDVNVLINKIEDLPCVQVQEIHKIEQGFRSFLVDNNSLLGVTFESALESSFELYREDFESLREDLQGCSPGNTNQAIDAWIDKAMSKDIGSLLGPINSSILDIAGSLNKTVNFHMINENIRVYPAVVRPVIQNLVHLLRNAIDHGIEHSWDRGDKSEQGHLLLSFNSTGADLVIQIVDDGRGVDSNQLMRSAIENGVITEEQSKQMNEQERLLLMFCSGLSTAAEVSEISGRGFGMTALKQAVDDIGGSLDVSTKVGQGTSFTLVIPGSVVNLTSDGSPKISA